MGDRGGRAGREVAGRRHLKVTAGCAHVPTSLREWGLTAAPGIVPAFLPNPLQGLEGTHSPAETLLRACADGQRVRMGRFQLKYQFLGDPSGEVQLPHCF